MDGRLIASLILVSLLAGCREQAPDTTQQLPPPASNAPVPVVAAAQPTASGVPWILPGDFAPDTTVEQLKHRYGAGNVSVQDVPGAEGESFRGVVLFPREASKRATLYFQDEQALRGLSMVSVDAPGSRWRLASGIGIGTPLAELQRRNGKPFLFSGFGWDYGGAIVDWQGGKLQPRDDNPVFENLRLQMPPEDPAKPYPTGDASFRSDDPRWTDLGIGVGAISVGFPGEDDL